MNNYTREVSETEEIKLLPSLVEWGKHDYSGA